MVSSYVFYAWGEDDYLLVLIGLTGLNYALGRLIEYRRNAGGLSAKQCMIFGIAANLIILGIFKYASFAVHQINGLTGWTLPDPHIDLPLGISFFTFHAIAYIIDTAKGGPVERSLPRFSLFMSFFPHMVAGPILRPHEFLPQFQSPPSERRTPLVFSQGVTLFALGLFKKVCIADVVAGYANDAFSAANSTLTVADAWSGALAYTMQIYFDFSGYSDMAIGLALMLGIRLPINFDSPYKSRNIIEFWRCWHMTLSRFLRDYLYIPLGGNRKGEVNRYVNLLVTMTLGGLWHGASWTFVVWGAIHGGCLCINHLWRTYVSRSDDEGNLFKQIAGTILTFLVVMIAWVFFRASSVEQALSMLGTMSGLAGAPLGPLSGPQPKTEIQILLGCLAIVWLFPNSQTIAGYGGLDSKATVTRGRWFTWQPSAAWGVFVAVILTISVLNMSRVSEFIYFHF